MTSKVAKVESQATARQVGITSATIWNASGDGASEHLLPDAEGPQDPLGRSLHSLPGAGRGVPVRRWRWELWGEEAAEKLMVKEGPELCPVDGAAPWRRREHWTREAAAPGPASGRRGQACWGHGGAPTETVCLAP